MLNSYVIWFICIKVHNLLWWGGPGLSQEVTAISEQLGIRDVNDFAANEMSSLMWKNLVNKAVWMDNEQYLGNKMENKLGLTCAKLRSSWG